MDLKTEVERLDGTPDKRMFWSIISDYGLQTGICELVDNALDFWILGGRENELNVEIVLDSDRQIISVTDNAGGVDKANLRLLIAPGGSGNNPLDEVIGVFGVGSKRASVALGETISIKTRRETLKSYQLDITKDWLETDDWDMPLYEIPSFKEASTEIKITELRRRIDDNEIKALKKRLGEIYSEFLNERCRFFVNDEEIAARSFEAWSYPPEFLPTETSFDIELADLGRVNVSISAGLIGDRNEFGENYGVYFYCNDRLIVKELKNREVGYFNSHEAGVPHSDASLARCIIWLNGAARAMPWNSSKSGINFDHPIFQELRPTLVSQVTYFSKLSRRLKNTWDETVFQHQTGSIRRIEPEELGPTKKVVFPELPKVRKKRIEALKQKNSAIITSQPWTLGLVETFGAVEVVKRQRFDTKNRMALILLDSNFEIALKEFIVNRTDLFPIGTYNDAKIASLFKNRPNVITEVVAKVPKIGPLTPKISYYYKLRNKLIHERATVGVTDHQIDDYRATVEKVLTELFGLSFVV